MNLNNLLHTEKLDMLLNFIKANNHCVISTNSATNDSPESAVVAFSQTDDLKLIFGSLHESRKNQNILKNPNVSLVIGWSQENYITIQYEGLARLLHGEEREKYAEAHCTKNPGSRAFKDLPNQEYFIIEPKWIRYSDVMEDEAKVFEVNFN